MANPQVYVVEWRKSLTELRGYLSQCGSFQCVSSIYRWYKPTNQLVETNDKTLVICPSKTIETLVQKFPDTFGKHVVPYDWSTFPLPKESENETHHLHIAGIPNDFRESDAIAYVHDQLKPLLPSNRYHVDFRLRSRTTGEINGFGEIRFNEGVDFETIKLCKLMLHNKPLGFKHDNKTSMIRCLWYKTVSNHGNISRRSINVHSVSPKVDLTESVLSSMSVASSAFSTSS